MNSGKRAVLAQDDDLVASLLSLPGATGDLVARRPRLLDLLTRSAHHPLVLVTGEPAAGKTTLVSTWLAEGRGGNRPLAWLTIRAVDDEVLLWRYILAAIVPLGIETGDLRTSLLDGGPPSESWLTALANRVGAVDGRPVLVLDDLHEVSSSSALESLGRFLDRLPSTVTSIVTSRSTPPWPLSAWRMSGRLREIESSDLRFSEREVCELVDLLDDLELDESDIARLVQRTEGWAGGVKLALLALRKSANPSGALARFAADDETMSTYLVRDVLDRQSSELQEFLLDTSLLEEFSAALCDAVLQRDDSRQLIEQCRAEQLFLAEVDGRTGVHRYHQLFAELLRARRETTDPGRSVEIHRRASVVFEAQGEVSRAIIHAAAARDSARVGSLIAHHAGDFAQRGRFDDIRGWLAMLSANATDELSEATFGLVMTLILSERPDDAVAVIDRVLESPISPRFHYGIDQLRAMAYMLRGDLRQLAGVASSLQREVPQGGVELPFDEARFQAHARGIAYYFEGDLERAAELLDRACRRRERPDLFYLESPGWKALVAVEQGQLDDAEVLSREALDRQAEMSSGETAVAVPGRLAQGLVAWERNDLVACREHLAVARRSVAPVLWETVLVECASSRLQASGGEIGRAIEDLLDVGKVFLHRHSETLLHGLVADRLADLYLRDDNTAEAARWMRTFSDMTGRQPRPSFEIRLARADTVPDVREVVGCALSRPSAMPERLDTLLAAAAVWSDLGDVDSARSCVSEAAGLAAREGHIRRFCDAGPVIGGVLRDLLDDPSHVADASVSPFFLASVVEAMSAVPAAWRTSVPVVEELVEQLSGRELEVLSLLDRDMSYSDIGARLYVSRNTVKSHVQHIYTKLGVSNRSAAVAEARRFGLL